MQKPIGGPLMGFLRAEEAWNTRKRLSACAGDGSRSVRSFLLFDYVRTRPLSLYGPWPGSAPPCSANSTFHLTRFVFCHLLAQCAPRTYCLAGHFAFSL